VLGWPLLLCDAAVAKCPWRSRWRDISSYTVEWHPRVQQAARPGYNVPGTAGGGAQCNIGAFDERTRVTTQRQSRIHHTGHVTGEFPLEASRESSGVGQWERSPVCCFRDDNDNDYRKRKYRTSLYEDSRTYSKEFLELRHLLPFFSLIDPVNSASGSGEHLSSPVEGLRQSSLYSRNRICVFWPYI